jgi:hypothetical protein
LLRFILIRQTNRGAGADMAWRMHA